MPSLADVLKKEISRLARKELRSQTEDLKRQSVAHRKTIADLRRRVSELESKVGLVQRKVLVEAPVAEPESGVEQPRFSKKGMVSARRRLGLSAAEFGTLIGVSAQTVYNWENGKSRPRAKQLKSLSELRGIGKREAAVRLELLAKG